MALRKGIAISAGAIFALAILVAFASGRIEEIRRAGEAVSWRWVVAAVIFSLGSHAMVGLALSETLTTLGHSLGGPLVLGIALVSTTANNLVSAAGATGFALKAHLLHKRRVPIATTVMASALTSAILYAVLAVILGEGFATLILRASGQRVAIMESGVGLLFLLVLAGAILTGFFNNHFRSRLINRLFRLTNRAAFSLSQTEIPPEDFKAFENQLAQGFARIRAGRGHLSWTILYTCFDWTCAMAALWFCFRAVGIRLGVGTLSAAFTTGQAATLIPLLPGGLGAAESSISALMGGIGIDAGAAFVAALLFRFSYYVVPSLLSVLVFWGLKVSEPTVFRDAANLERALDGARAKQ